ncbi:MAG: alkaline phosphatase [Osedax symbiont Rs2]|nr:MAG: alkaline phosphatase [Osedax symbiont Rs2]
MDLLKCSILSLSILLANHVYALQISQTKDRWYQASLKTLAKIKAQRHITTKAKNIILFIGDGNGVSTVTATRIYAGQKRGLSGEEHVLSYDALPNVALAKTYNTNAQTPDSAGTATAILTGIKTKAGLLSVTDAVVRGDCVAALANNATTVFELAEAAGMSTGIVSTARVTHATPAAAYAHSADRNYEDDSKLSAAQKAAGCIDIATALVEFNIGDGIDVIMGGGRRHFIGIGSVDEEGKKGRRTDGKNLIQRWQNRYKDGVYIWNQQGFDHLSTGNQKVLALFNNSHMAYEIDRAADKGGEPSLAQMTAKSIQLLSKNQQGYMLMVESGRIDHAHHQGNAKRALEDGLAFDAAVQVALQSTDPLDTLIIVTADHSHTLMMQGYAKRGNDILGLSYAIDAGDGKNIGKLNLSSDGKPYTTLVYANGPGGSVGERPDLTKTDVTDVDYQQQAIVVRKSETHSGEDVAIYARGPKAHLFAGTVEQNYIFQVMNEAADLVVRAMAN